MAKEYITKYWNRPLKTTEAEATITMDITKLFSTPEQNIPYITSRIIMLHYKHRRRYSKLLYFMSILTPFMTLQNSWTIFTISQKQF